MPKNDDGSTALMAAALKGDADIVQILLSAGADIKVKDKDEDTALNWLLRMVTAA